jgi:dTDP-glucose 4,6-dehydratase
MQINVIRKLFISMKILVTGGAGFIGSNFIHYWLNKYPEDIIVNLDVLTYAGNTDNLLNVNEKYGDGALAGAKRYYFVKGDIRDVNVVNSLMAKVDAVVHFAAESHVDRSIDDPQAFLTTNVLGTHTLLEAVRTNNIKRFLHISTDEVYGSVERGYCREESELKPNSPYSSSKAGADLLAMAYFKTYKLPVIITRTTNNFGPYQHPEKFIPLFITNLIEDKTVPLYGYGLNRRDWIYVEDNCAALDAVFHRGRIGEIYNISTNTNELSNIEISSLLAYKLNKPPHLMEFVKDRPGHDFRYGVDSTKIRTELSWTHQYDLPSGLEKTINWYKDNEWWWRKIKEGEYKNYYDKQYQKT